VNCGGTTIATDIAPGANSTNGFFIQTVSSYHFHSSTTVAGKASDAIRDVCSKKLSSQAGVVVVFLRDTLLVLIKISPGTLRKSSAL
jgi:hypothetical protein